MDCSFCKNLAPYCGSDQTSNYLDDALRGRMRRIKYDGGEEILSCPECGKYYYFHEWTPGGSDDAMTTTYHQDFYALAPYELYQQLYPNPEEPEPGYFKNHAVEICRGAIEYLRTEHSQKVHETYRPKTVRSALRATEILQAAQAFLPRHWNLPISTSPLLHRIHPTQIR